MHRHHSVGTANIFADIKEHVGELELAVVVAQHELDLVLARDTGFRIRFYITATFHAKNLDFDIFLELKLRIVQRHEHDLEPVRSSRDYNLAPKIFEVRDRAG